LVHDAATQRWDTQLWPVQSALVLQATHVPVPSHTLPPLSVHVALAAVSVVPHVLLAHVEVRHAVLGAMQSVGALHPTHMPAELPDGSAHTLPPAQVPAIGVWVGVGPLQVPWWHPSMGAGVLVGSATLLVPLTVPSQATTRQSPVVCWPGAGVMAGRPTTAQHPASQRFVAHTPVRGRLQSVSAVQDIVQADASPPVPTLGPVKSKGPRMFVQAPAPRVDAKAKQTTTKPARRVLIVA
jgi:hypothetical protein